jgi:hypothetical protein
MAKERSLVGTRSGKGESFFNPGDLFQFARRLGAKPTKSSGYGFYKGQPEFSLGFSMDKPQKHRWMNTANQQSVFSTSGIEGKGWNEKTKYMLSVTISNARKLLHDEGFSRDVYRYRTLQQMISNANSGSYLFDGGTVFERGNDIEIQSAFFGSKQELAQTVSRMRSFVSKLHSIGINARYSVHRR